MMNFAGPAPPALWRPWGSAEECVAASCRGPGFPRAPGHLVTTAPAWALAGSTHCPCPGRRCLARRLLASQVPLCELSETEAAGRKQYTIHRFPRKRLEWFGSLKLDETQILGAVLLILTLGAARWFSLSESLSGDRELCCWRFRFDFMTTHALPSSLPLGQPPKSIQCPREERPGFPRSSQERL